MPASTSFLLPKLQSRQGQVDRILAAIMGLPADKAWRVTIEEAKSNRSLKQNAYLWAVPYKMIGDAIGYEYEEVAEYLCGTYFGWKEKRVPKKPGRAEGIEMVPIRTTTVDAEGRRSVLSKMAFSEYVAFVQRFGAGKGIVIPDPDPYYASHRREVSA